MSATVKTFVDGKIGGKKVVMFSKTYCPYCKKAKGALAKCKLSADDYEVIEIENNPDMDAIQDYLKSITGGRSVPRVFINGKCIGGGDETASLQSSGELQKMLA